MKNYIKYGRLSLFVSILMLAAIGFSSCDNNDDIITGKVDETPYEAAKKSYGYLRSVNDARNTLKLEMHSNTSTQEVVFGLTKAMDKDLSVSIEIDESMVEKYNLEHFTEFEIFPKDLISIADNGTINIAKGATKSSPVNITINKRDDLVGKTYLLPISVSENSLGDLQLSSDGKILYYLITVSKGIPNNDKGVVSICYVEVNSNNILNVGSYTLKDSGKQFYDIAIIFAANINYDPEQGKAVLFFNPNVDHLLKNRDKYIKPLQDKGIKVSLSVLGNHQGVGPANLTQESILDFAAQCKATVDIYGLDGIDFDDEWSKYGSVPGLPNTNGTSYGRLLIELRRIMPDKLITVYHIGYSSTLYTPIDGVGIGTIIDYSYYPYYGSYSTSGMSISGLQKKQWGPAPIAFHGTSGTQINPSPSNPTNNTNRIVSDGYGVNLCYDMREKDYSAYLTRISTILYREETVKSGATYLKDW